MKFFKGKTAVVVMVSMVILVLFLCILEMGRGDINLDGRVDIKDLSKISQNFKF
jgi:hypothetical protein